MSPVTPFDSLDPESSAVRPRLRHRPLVDGTRRPRAIASLAVIRRGPLGLRWADWLLVGQVAAVSIVLLWLGLAGYVTFGQPPV